MKGKALAVTEELLDFLTSQPHSKIVVRKERWSVKKESRNVGDLLRFLL
jgi:hypothetical protein